jgi:tripartite-type tricarboxylate transporter receptor subunit TctC
MATLLAEGSLPTTGSPEQAAQFLKAEQQRWGAVVRDAKVKVD